MYTLSPALTKPSGESAPKKALFLSTRLRNPEEPEKTVFSTLRLMGASDSYPSGGIV